MCAWAVAPAASLAAASFAVAQPANDACEQAQILAPGVPASGTLAGAAADGASSCGLTGGRDVFYRLTAQSTGVHTLRLCEGARWDSVLSVHPQCPAGLLNEWACDDEGCRPTGAPGFGWLSSLGVHLDAGESCIVRVAAFDASVPGAAFVLLADPPAPEVGACCVEGACVIVDAASCSTLDGVFLGAWSACLGAGSLIAEPTVNFGNGLAIPDANAAGVSSTVVLAAAGPVGDVEVWIDLAHPFAGDLRLTLTHGGESAAVIARLGGGELGDSSGLDGAYVFRDGESGSLWRAAREATGQELIAPGAYRASNDAGATVRLRGVFGGLAAAGEWTMTIADEIALGTGWVRGWGLRVRGSTGELCTPGVGACCVAGGAVCIPYTRAECEASGGVFAGAAQPCQDVEGNPLGCCPANFDQSGGVTLGDLFAFLQAWFAFDLAADSDGDGTTTVLDIFVYLDSWFQGCLVRQTGGPGACCRGPEQAGLGTLCSVRAEAQCLFVGGVYRGAGVPCEQGAGNPTACCRANFDGEGGVGPPDIFAFLAAWFAGEPGADVDQNGQVQTPDIFEFLGAFFAGCP